MHSCSFALSIVNKFIFAETKNQHLIELTAAEAWTGACTLHEESPGFKETRCQLTTGRGNPTD